MIVTVWAHRVCRNGHAGRGWSAHFGADAIASGGSTGVVIPVYFLPAAMALRMAGEARYVAAVLRGQARPNPVSWFCWALAPVVAFAAQLSHGLRPTEWMTLVIAIGPVAAVMPRRCWRPPCRWRATWASSRRC